MRPMVQSAIVVHSRITHAPALQSSPAPQSPASVHGAHVPSMHAAPWHSLLAWHSRITQRPSLQRSVALQSEVRAHCSGTHWLASQISSDRQSLRALHGRLERQPDRTITAAAAQSAMCLCK